MTERLCLGIITGVKGLKGEIRLKSFTGETDHLFRLGPLESEDGTQRFHLFAVKESPNGAPGSVTAQIKGVQDRNAAEALKGTKLFIARAKLPKLSEGEFYHADLVGLAVHDEKGVPIGTLKDVHDFGAGDIFEISPLSGPSFMVSYTQDAVPEIDLANRRLTLCRPPEIEAGEEEKEGKHDE